MSHRDLCGGRAALGLALAALLFWGAACSRTQVVIGSPDQRYDHNRTREVSIMAGDSAGAAATLEAACFAPYAREGWPSVRVGDCPSPADGLAHAVLVPVFTGVPLPLSSSGPGSDDRADLLEFLAAGPLAKAGIERPDATGDLALADREFRPVLDIMASADALRGSPEEVTARLAAIHIKAPRVNIVDSRFSPLSFAHRLAFRVRRFWFILFRAPGQAAYSRLVVVPERVT